MSKYFRSPLLALRTLEEIRETQLAMLRVQVAAERARLLEDLKRSVPMSPACAGFKVYSQTDEDGIIEEIFRRIGTSNRIFVEIGCGDGLENNTAYLLLKGFAGVWIDASAKNIRRIEAALSPLDPARLVLRPALVTRENVNAVLGDALVALVGDAQPAIDFLSIDIDGNDIHVLEALQCTVARVLCVEYNPKFPPPLGIAVTYDAQRSWEDDDYHGASLQAWADLLEKKGYKLVACNLAGTNAFFALAECASQFGAYSPAQHWQPARYDLWHMAAGHRASLKFLRDATGRRGSR